MGKLKLPLTGLLHKLFWSSMIIHIAFVECVCRYTYTAVKTLEKISLIIIKYLTILL